LRRLTKRAVDWRDSARFTSIFLASGFFCSQTFSQSARQPLTRTVRRNAHFLLYCFWRNARARQVMVYQLCPPCSSASDLPNQAGSRVVRSGRVLRLSCNQMVVWSGLGLCHHGNVGFDAVRWPAVSPLPGFGLCLWAGSVKRSV
jgi:hypothetical protein